MALWCKKEDAIVSKTIKVWVRIPPRLPIKYRNEKEKFLIAYYQGVFVGVVPDMILYLSETYRSRRSKKCALVIKSVNISTHVTCHNAHYKRKLMNTTSKVLKIFSLLLLSFIITVYILLLSPPIYLVYCTIAEKCG